MKGTGQPRIGLNQGKGRAPVKWTHPLNGVTAASVTSTAVDP